MTIHPIQCLTRFRYITVCASLLAYCPVWAQEKPTMRWWQFHLPPSTILVDEQPTNGIADQKLRIIMDQWPEVRHEFLGAKPARIWSDMATPDSRACFNSAILTPERELHFYMTATHLSPPVNVVAQSAVLRRMAKNASGEVLPGALFDRTDLSGILIPGRSYSALLDTLLSHRSPDVKLDFVNQSNGGTNILQMIVLGRADYTLEYDRTLNYLTGTEPRLKNAGLQSAPIAGGKVSQVGIACPRNAWGYATIKKLDAIVKALAGTPEFQRQNSVWISANERARMKPALDAFYKERAKPTPPDRYTPP